MANVAEERLDFQLSLTLLDPFGECENYLNLACGEFKDWIVASTEAEGSSQYAQNILAFLCPLPLPSAPSQKTVLLYKEHFAIEMNQLFHIKNLWCNHGYQETYC